MKSEAQREKELDELLLLLSKPLTRLILSVLTGKDPCFSRNKTSERIESSEESRG